VTQIQQNRYDQLLRRVADLKGAGSKVSDALTELFPVIDVERVPGELLLLGGTSLGLGSTTVTGSAGQNARIQLFNPAGSGKLVTVSSCLVSSSNSQTIRFAVTGTALATGIGTEVFRDFRLGGTARPTAQMRTADTVAFTDANGQFRVIGNTPFEVEDPNGICVLPEGSGLEFGTGTNATPLFITFFWRERVAEPSELTF